MLNLFLFSSYSTQSFRQIGLFNNFDQLFLSFFHDLPPILHLPNLMRRLVDYIPRNQFVCQPCKILLFPLLLIIRMVFGTRTNNHQERIGALDRADTTSFLESEQDSPVTAPNEIATLVGIPTADVILLYAP